MQQAGICYRWYSFTVFAGETVIHHAVFAEGQPDHTAFSSKLVLADGIETEFQFVIVFINGLSVKFIIFHENLVDDKIGVFGMLVLAAAVFPAGFVRIRDSYILDGNDRFRLLALCGCKESGEETFMRSYIQFFPVAEDYKHPVCVNKSHEPGVNTWHAARMTDNEPKFLILCEKPAEAVAVSVLVYKGFSVVERDWCVHYLLFLMGQYGALAKSPVPLEHIEDIGINVVVAVQTVKSGHIANFPGIHVGNKPAFLIHCCACVILKRNAITADMAALRAAHPCRLENVLLQKDLKRNTGESFHQQRQKVVAGVGIYEFLSRSTVGLCLGLTEEA